MIHRKSFLPEHLLAHPVAEAAGMSWHEMDHLPHHPNHHWHHQQMQLLLQLMEERHVISKNQIQMVTKIKFAVS